MSSEDQPSGVQPEVVYSEDRLQQGIKTFEADLAARTEGITPAGSSAEPKPPDEGEPSRGNEEKLDTGLGSVGVTSPANPPGSTSPTPLTTDDESSQIGDQARAADGGFLQPDRPGESETTDLEPGDIELREQAIREAKEGLEDKIRRLDEWRKQPGNEDKAFHDWWRETTDSNYGQYDDYTINPHELIDARVTAEDLERYRAILTPNEYSLVQSDIHYVLSNMREADVRFPEDARWRDEMFAYVDEEIKHREQAELQRRQEGELASLDIPKGRGGLPGFLRRGPRPATPEQAATATAKQAEPEVSDEERERLEEEFEGILDRLSALAEVDPVRIEMVKKLPYLLDVLRKDPKDTKVQEVLDRLNGPDFDEVTKEWANKQQ